MLLYTFRPGDLIVASEINHNFQEIAKVLGLDSSADALHLPGRVAIGANRLATISSATDRVNAATRYLHIGWNAEERIVSNKVSLQRKSEGKGIGSTAIRVSGAGFSVLGTTKDTGDINAQLDTLFSVRQSGVAYLNPHVSFVTQENPNSIEDYRLTFRPLEQAVVILNKTGVADNASYSFDCTSIKDQLGGYNFHGVELVVAATANDQASEVCVYGKGLTKYTGVMLSVHQRSIDHTRGCAIFKRGSGGNRTLTITSTHDLSSLVVRVVGVWR